MTAAAIVLDVLVVLTTAAILVSARRAWRNEQPWLDPDAPRAWTGGLPSWRGWVRVQAVIVPTVFVIAAPLFVIQSTGVGGGAWDTVRAVAGLVICGVLLAGARVWLFNRPRWLVAPHLRHQPGMIAESLGERCAPTPLPRRPRRRGARDQEALPAPPPDA
jgi:hypothetical protein